MQFLTDTLTNVAIIGDTQIIDVLPNNAAIGVSLCRNRQFNTEERDDGGLEGGAREQILEGGDFGEAMERPTAVSKQRPIAELIEEGSRVEPRLEHGAKLEPKDQQAEVESWVRRPSHQGASGNQAAQGGAEESDKARGGGLDSNDIDEIAGGPHAVFVFTICAHRVFHPITFYVHEVAKIRQSVVALLSRAPETTVIIKSGNTAGVKDIFRSDWYTMQLNTVMKEMFRDIDGVIYFDVWQMTSCHYLLENIHPGPVIIDNEINILLSYICPS
ncbi:NXPE family member 3 [Anabarilius grahami]|uniref:NXPE family member 3 n=1 Tax=Anabarilius grahami TaxID=495550 RepID=A0A3N0XMW8_ANAGA|nr:NXPE family member 3 [Anabarilius grahami]